MEAVRKPTKYNSNYSKNMSLRNRRVVVNSRSKKISLKKRKHKTLRNKNNGTSRCTSNENVRQNTKLINTGKSKLSCVYFNARSIVNKHKELEIYVLEKKFDIIGITESWLNAEILDNEMSIEGYNLHRNDRNNAEKHRGGEGGGLQYMSTMILIVFIEMRYLSKTFQ